MVDVLVYTLAVGVGIGLFGAISLVGLASDGGNVPYETAAAPSPRRVLALNAPRLNRNTVPDGTDLLQEDEAA